jgi:hypothetical protein
MLSPPSTSAYYSPPLHRSNGTGSPFVVTGPILPVQVSTGLSPRNSINKQGISQQEGTLSPVSIKPNVSPRKHLANALLLILAGIIFKRLPPNVVHPRLHTPLLSSDWKEWAKVGLGIGAMNQLMQAFNYKPPLWLQAMLNVMIVGPMVAGVTRRNILQSAILSPFVAMMAQITQWASNKSERPLKEKYNIPPLVTHAVFSFGMVLAGLRLFPWVNGAIPGSANTAAASRTGLMSTCANGCCSSLVCVNDIGQLGASLYRSTHHPSKSHQPD